MKNRVLRSMAILSVFFMLAVVGTRAQTPTRAEVTIPFDFTAGKANLKSGTYTVERVSDRVIALRSKDGRTRAIVNAALTIESRKASGTERLVFNRYEHQYFLAEVWLSPEVGRQLFSTGDEVRVAKEFKINKQLPKRVDIAMLTH